MCRSAFRSRFTLTAFVTALVTTGALLVGGGQAAARESTGPPTVTADDVRFTPGKTLRYGSAREAGLVPKYVDRLPDTVARYLEPSPEHPQYAGAVEIAARRGVVVSHEAVGYALRYESYDAESGAVVELPERERIRMRRDSIFDLASISKLFTSLAALQLVERRKVDLDAPVASYVPEFAQNGKDDITVRHLLTHTSGLRPDPSPNLCAYDTDEERWAVLYAEVPEAEPGARYVYSDINMMMLQQVVERVTGESLETVVRERITAPLGMRDTMYNPPASAMSRVVATEYQPWTGRTMIRGTVHDENAYCLGGVAGHAGVFSTARDLAVLAQTVLDGGRYGRTRILEPDSVRSLLTNFNTAFPGDDHGLGFELNQHWYMDGLTSPVTAGHTGYTGTSLVIDPLSHSFVILLANRVHPTRDWGSNNPSRRAVARDMGLAVPVQPARGRDAWFSGVVDARTATLRLPLDVPSDGGRLAFELWYDTEGGYDIGSLQASTDGGATWQNVPLDLRAHRSHWSTEGTFSGFEGRQWLSAAARLPDGMTDLRWQYASDTLNQGRGVYVDHVRAWSAYGALLFHDSRPGDAASYQPDGWTRSST